MSKDEPGLGNPFRARVPVESPRVVRVGRKLFRLPVVRDFLRSLLLLPSGRSQFPQTGIETLGEEGGPQEASCK